MASVALAGPPRVNDKLQTCPTVYKSRTLVESSPRAFFCQTPDASLDHGVGLSRDISDPGPQRIILQNATGPGSENLFLTRNAWCASRDAFWKSVLPRHAEKINYLLIAASSTVPLLALASIPYQNPDENVAFSAK